jgi:uroporphyrinogen-III decarboxylase
MERNALRRDPGGGSGPRSGGFVCCQVHNILPNVPPENVAAMFAAVKETWG